MAERVKDALEKIDKALQDVRQSKRTMKDVVAAYILSLYEASLRTKETYTFSNPRGYGEVKIKNGKLLEWGQVERDIEWYLFYLMGTQFKLGDVRKFLEDIKGYSIVTPEMVDGKLKILSKIRSKKISRKKIPKYFVNPKLLEELEIK